MKPTVLGTLICVAGLLLPSRASAQLNVPLPAFWNAGGQNWVDPLGHYWLPQPLALLGGTIPVTYPDNTTGENYYLVSIPSGAPTVTTPVTISSLTVSPGAGVNIGSTLGSLSVVGYENVVAALVNDGLITLSGNGALVGPLGVLALNGEGTIRLQSGTASFAAGFSSATVQHGTGHTIAGHGIVGSTVTTIINNGVFQGDDTNGDLLVQSAVFTNPGEVLATNFGRVVLQPLQWSSSGAIEAAGGFIKIENTSGSSSGVIRGRNGGIAQLDNVTFDNTGGLLEALAGSVVELQNGASSKSGQFHTVADGVIQADTGTVTLQNAIVNQGHFLAQNVQLQFSQVSLDNRGGILEFGSGSSGLATSPFTLVGGTVRGSPTFQLTWPSLFDATQGLLIDRTHIYVATLATAPLTVRGFVTNNGLIELGQGASMIVASDPLIFIGTGAVFGGDVSGTNQTLINGLQHTFHGKMNLGHDSIQLLNQGFIVGDVPGQPLEVQMTGHGVTNQNVLAAQNGGILRLNAGFVENTAGMIQAGSNSTVTILGDLDIYGGLLAGSNNGVFVSSGGTPTLDGSAPGGITLAGHFVTGYTLTAHLNTLLHNYGLLSDDGAVVQLDTTPFTFDGTGQFHLGFLNPSGGRLVAPTNGVVTNAVGHTIAGSGNLGEGSFRIVNQGIIAGTEIGLNGMIVLSSGRLFENDGLLIATNNAILQLSGGDFLNVNGHIVAANGSQLQFASARIIGGELRADGTGVMNNAGSGVTLDGSTAGGPVRVSGTLATAFNSNLHTRGEIQNNGLMNFIGGNTSSGLLILDQDSLIDGGGTVRLTTGGLMGASPVGATLTLGAGQTLDGQGVAGLDQMNLVNYGTIVADDTSHHSLTLSFSGRLLTNLGVMKATSGGNLILHDGRFVNHGNVIEAQNGSVVTLNDYSTRIEGGELRADPGGLIELNGYPFLDGTGPDGLTLRGNVRTDVCFPTFAGTFHNFGVFSNHWGTIFCTNNVTVDGPGTIVFDDASQGGSATLNGLDGTPGLTFTLAAGSTFAGQGNLGLNHLNYLNQGLFRADSPSGLTLQFQIDGRAITNQGELLAQAPGTITLFRGTNYNQLGAMVANGSMFFLSDTRIVVGLLQSLNGGGFQNGGVCILDGTGPGGLTLAGNYTAAGTVALEGSITNNGKITISAGSLRIDNAVTLNGSGEVYFTTAYGSGGTANSITATGNSSLTFGPGQYFHGQGNCGLNNMDFTNLGIIHVEGTVNEALNFYLTGHSFVNYGLLSPTITNLVQFFGGTILNAPSGTLAGNGLIIGPAGGILNQGTISPGTSPGKLQIQGVFTNTPSSRLLIELAGADSPGTNYDQLVFVNTVKLDGLLSVSILNGFVPALGNAFTIVTGNPLVGAFAQRLLPAPAPGLAFQVLTTNNSVVLNIVTSTPAITFSNWVAGLGLPTNLSGPLDQPFGDGIPNIVKFAFGLNGSQADPNNSVTPELVTLGGQQYFAIDFNRSTTAAGIQFLLQETDSLNPPAWGLASFALEKIADLDATTERLRLRETVPITGHTQRFFRLQILYGG